MEITMFFLGCACGLVVGAYLAHYFENRGRMA